MPESSVHRIICPYDCPSTCGLLATVENGKVVKVKKDPEHPVSNTVICRKMQQYEESINSKDRILYPMKRTGKKGEGKFTRISWEEAIQTITDRWKQIIAEHGPQAIVPAIYSGVMSDIQRNCGDAFFHRMGAPELQKTICSSGKGAGYASVMGSTGALDPRELEDSDLILVWGSNLSATRLQTLALLHKTKKRRKMIMIDVYANPSARFCDDVLLLRGGTDGALVLAMMHVLVRDGLTDEEFLKEYTVGYPEFREQLPEYTPEWASGITGIPADKIEDLAHTYAAAKAPAIILGSGPSRRSNGGMMTRLIVLLPAMVGAWKKPGGGFCGNGPAAGPYVDLKLIKRPDFWKEPHRRVNINLLPTALSENAEEKVYSLYVYALNPANTVGNQELLMKDLKREDLFTVVHERFLTDTAIYADILLPATFSVEQSDIYRCYGYCTLGTQRKIVDAPGECKSNWDTFSLLAEAMGYTEEYFSRTEDEMLDYILDHPTKLTAELPEEKKQILREGGSISMPFADHLDIQTPSGKIQFVDPTLERPLAGWLPQEEGNYPLRLIASPSEWTLNTTFSEREDLRGHREKQELLINPQDAIDRGIFNGQDIVAFNDLAEVDFVAGVTDRVGRGNVICEGVFHHEETRSHNNFNALQHEQLSDIGEATTLNNNFVDIKPVDDYDWLFQMIV